MSTHDIMMLDRPLRVEISRAAQRQLDSMRDRLNLEMELYFSCLIRKRVLVRDSVDADFNADVTDKLRIGFRPVMTQACGIADTDEDGRPPLTDFPIEKPERYIPHWLRIDYRKGAWQAEFGYLDG